MLFMATVEEEGEEAEAGEEGGKHVSLGRGRPEDL